MKVEGSQTVRGVVSQAADQCMSVNAACFLKGTRGRRKSVMLVNVLQDHLHCSITLNEHGLTQHSRLSIG